MKEMHLDPNIVSYMKYLNNSSKYLFSQGFKYTFSEISYEEKIYIEAKLVFSDSSWLNKKESILFLYFDPTNGDLLVNDYIGSDKYIQLDHEKVLAYKSTYKSGGRGSHTTYDIYIKTLETFYDRLFKEKKCVFNSYLNPKEIRNIFRKEGGITVKSLLFNERSSGRGHYGLSLSLEIAGNKKKELNFHVRIDNEYSESASIYIFSSKKEHLSESLVKNKYEPILKFVKEVISELEQNTEFVFNNRPEISVIQFFNNPAEEPEYQEIFDELARWSAYHTQLPKIDLTIFSKKETEEEIIDANSEISFLIKDLKDKLKKEQPLRKRFKALWKKNEKHITQEQGPDGGLSEFGMALTLLESQVEMMDKNYEAHCAVLKEMIVVQHNMFRKLIEKRKLTYYAETTHVLDSLLDSVEKGA